MTDFIEPTNEKRASWAAAAIYAYATQTWQIHDLVAADVEDGGYAEILEQVAGDMVADLMHLCDRHSIPFEDALDTARMNYEEEVFEEREVNSRHD